MSGPSGARKGCCLWGGSRLSRPQPVFPQFAAALGGRREDLHAGADVRLAAVLASSRKRRGHKNRTSAMLGPLEKARRPNVLAMESPTGTASRSIPSQSQLDAVFQNVTPRQRRERPHGPRQAEGGPL
jgi:hypothetical protein